MIYAIIAFSLAVAAAWLMNWAIDQNDKLNQTKELMGKEDERATT